MQDHFSYQGRLRRLPYFWRVLTISVIELAVILGVFWFRHILGIGFQDAYVLSELITVAGAFVISFAVVKRLHDLGRPGWHYWLLLIPFYGLYLGFLLLFGKGTPGPNAYDQVPVEASTSSPLYAPEYETKPERVDVSYEVADSGAVSDEVDLGSQPGMRQANPADPAITPTATPERRKTRYAAAVESSPAADAKAKRPITSGRKIVGFLISYTWDPNGQLFPIREGRNLIGRDAEQCDIAVPQDEALSAVNSHISFRKNFVVGDIVSMSGTYVNGEPVEGQFKALPKNAAIRTGATSWTFMALEPEKSDAGLSGNPQAGDSNG